MPEQPRNARSRLTHRQFVLLLVLGCLGLNLAIDGALGWAVQRSRAQHEKAAETTVANLSKVLEQNIRSLFQKTDLLLQAVVAEEAARSAPAGPNDSAFAEFLRVQSVSVPETRGLRVTNETGDVLYAIGMSNTPALNFGDRSYFRQVQTDPQAGLVISEPIFGQFSQRWLLSFCRRISRHDGTFGGAVFTAMPLDTIEDLFANLDLGAHGHVSLWDQQSMLARYPDLIGADNVAHPARPSPELRALLDAGTKMAIYRTAASSDHVRRVYAVRRVGEFSLWIVAGTASQDYLAAWREDAQRMAVVALAFALITIGMSWQIYRLWRLGRIRIAEMLVRESGEQTKEAQALAHLGTWIRDRQSGRYIWSDEVFRIYGYPPQSFTPDVAFVHAATHPDDRAALLEMVENPSQSHENRILQHRIVHPDGTVRWVHVTGRMEHDEDGRHDRVVGIIRDITENKEAETLLAESHALHEAVIAGSRVAIAVFEHEGRCILVNDAYVQLTGGTRAALLKQNFQTIRSWQGCALLPAALETLETGKPTQVTLFTTSTFGRSMWLEVLFTRIRHAGSSRLLFLGTDITVRRTAEERLRLAASVFSNTQEGIHVTDPQGINVAVNPACCRITGYSEKELIGQNMRLLNSGRHDQAFFQDLFTTISTDGYWQGEIWNRRKNGEIYPQWLTISTVRDEQGMLLNYVGTFTDITQVKQSETKLEHLAHHDSLTDLPNRLLLHARLEQAIAMAKRSGKKGAALFLDLDRFKNVNDSFGHPVGDELLQKVVERYQRRLRTSDTLARMGGDEFFVLLEGIEDIHDVAIVAQSLIDETTAPFDLSGGQEVYIGTTVGISIFPDDSDVTEQVIRNADTALYQAKGTRRGTFHFYTEALTQASNARVELEGRLRRALERDEFVVYYQPLVSLESRRIVGVEALVRWLDPVEGLILPMKFIPLAEETGLINPLGARVLRTACAQMKAWLDSGTDLQTLSVNLSPVQCLRTDIADIIRLALTEADLPARYLELEITESTLMEFGPDVEAKMNAMKALGIRLAIDDFGTGYSSLAYLKRLPIDKLKVDRTFVQDVPDDPADCEITSAIVGLGRNLKLATLAEGVETEAQYSFLRKLGCNQAQGYLFGRPMPADELEHLVRAQNAEGGIQ